MVILYLAIALVVGYLIGNINFARIFSWAFARKDITTVGSKNPGTMNMLRTRGFGEAFLTLIMEAIKAPKKTLFVVAENEEATNAYLSARNIPGVMMLTSTGINVFDLVNANAIVMTSAAVKEVEEALA